MDEKTEKNPSVAGSIEKIDIEHASTSENKRFIGTPSEKKLVKKINLAFAPFLCLILFIQVSLAVEIQPYEKTNFCTVLRQNNAVHSCHSSTILQRHSYHSRSILLDIIHLLLGLSLHADIQQLHAPEISYSQICGHRACHLGRYFAFHGMGNQF